SSSATARSSRTPRRWSRAGRSSTRWWRPGRAPDRNRTGPVNGVRGPPTNCWPGMAAGGGGREPPGRTRANQEDPVISLWDTTGSEVVKALAAERRSAGGVASGMALTLIVIVDEPRVREAEAAVTIASAAHPCRLLM